MLGITKTFPGVVANRDVSLKVARGEIHGLLGENGAGKSTLMNILYGLQQPDEGLIELDGTPVEISSPRHAAEHGIGMVHQHFMLVPDMTVAENVALGLPMSGFPLSRLGRVASRISQLSARYRLHVDPSGLIGELSVGMQQRVEILKLLYRDTRLLVLDEPTAVLTPQEWEQLTTVLRSVAAEGRSVIFISHKLEESLTVTDRCTILRDGALVGTVVTSEATKATLARMMVGRDVVLRVERPAVKPGKTLLEADDVSLEDARGTPRLQGVSFEVRQGEIFGIAGVAGNGQQELADVLMGVVTPTRGDVQVADAVVTKTGPRQHRAKGQAIIPEDRHRTAVLLDASLQDNLMLNDYDSRAFARFGFLRSTRIGEHCRRLVREYDVRVPGLHVRMRQLSGGNQQKAVLARELSRKPTVLIAVQPTRGLDVGAMEFVYRRLLEHRTAMGAVVLISMELDEILSLSDRLAVMIDGCLTGIRRNEDIDTGELGLLMAGSSGPELDGGDRPEP